MICEMCGQDVPSLRKINIEGSALSVCKNCMKFGKGVDPSKSQNEAAIPDTISERLERREKRLKTKDVYEGTQDELALDYPSRIRNARSQQGLKQEDLAKKINEKKSIVMKLEHGEMVPDEKLIGKLERALSITLREKITAKATPTKHEQSKKMTLGDLIKIKKEA